jgi:methylated-DNA-[protein]-cysteine S-methyltransferase
VHKLINLYTKNVEGVWFGVASNESKVFATAFGFEEESVMRNLLEDIIFNEPFQYSEKASALAEKVIISLKDVYDGKGLAQSLPLATEHLSEYAKKVIESVSMIPLGYVSSYAAIAEVADGSPRSVGRVMALNPFPLIVPCHRVVNSNFSLGGYGGGLKLKLTILKRECRGYSSQMELPVDNAKLRLFPVEFVLKRWKRVNVNSLDNNTTLK